MEHKQSQTSEKQKEVWLFLVKHIERFGYQPTRRVMAEALGIDKRAIQDRLNGLEKRGLVELHDGGVVVLRHVRFKAVFDDGAGSEGRTRGRP